MGISQSHRHRFVTEKLLNFLDAGTPHDQVTGEGVPQVAKPDVVIPALLKAP